MRSARVKSDTGAGYYHCISRVIERRFALGRKEKEKFRTMMRLVEGFCGVQVLTYCLMDNHWHVLVNIPERMGIDDGELIRRMRLVYDKPMVKEFEIRLKEVRDEEKSDDPEIAKAAQLLAERMREQYIYRMYDLSEFIKMLKQRFTMWYNKSNGRRGTLWEDRFKSVLVEDSQHAIINMAAYIDLNPVRAGMMKDPKDYRFSGYGEAVGGGKKARAGINAVLLSLAYNAGWDKTSAEYRKLLYATGLTEGSAPAGAATKPGFSYDQVEKVMESNGKLSQQELLRCRVRYFTDGVVFGSKEFVERVFQSNRNEFGVKRTTGARKPRVYGALDGLYSMRDLRQAVITVPDRQAA